MLATLTPEEVNEDRLKFAQSLIEEADQDLGQLGLKLDTLKIQNVSDDAGYLDSIGRRKTAEVLSAARTAEAERIILQQKRLTTDVIEPARAKREAMELEAKGAAASIIEDGEAKARVLKEMIATYASAAGEGEKVFVLNMLPEIVAELARTVEKVTVDKVSVIDNGGGNGNGHGSGLSRFVTQFPGAVISLSEQIENATGVSLLSGLGKQVEDAKIAGKKKRESEDAQEDPPGHLADGGSEPAAAAPVG